MKLGTFVVVVEIRKKIIMLAHLIFVRIGKLIVVLKTLTTFSSSICLVG